MREIRQSGSEGGGNEQTVSPYPYFTFPPTPNFFINDLKPTFSYRAADVNPPVLALRLFTSH